MFTALRPVGERFPLKYSDLKESELETLSEFKFQGYASGTQALAAAINLSKHRRPDCTQPEVIIPAYTCPDVVSACIFAEVKPVLVDFSEESPQYDMADLTAKLSDNTIAIIAVNFLGIPQDVSSIKALTEGRGITIIEDSAQYFPRDVTNHGWEADIVTLSFGRGKPLNFFYGGALLHRRCVVESPERSVIIPSINPVTFFLKHQVYNLLMHPFFYYWITRIPGTSIGQTKYHACTNLESLAPNTLQALEKRIADFKELGLNLAIFETLKVLDFNGRLISNSPHNYLRIPILADNENQLDQVENDKEFVTLGVSRMYRKTLTQFEDIPLTLGKLGDHPNAEQFSRRLLTIPNHRDVDKSQLSRICQLLKSL